mgnify:CR=1 FL=1
MVLTRPCRLGPQGGPVLPLPAIIHSHPRGRAGKRREKLVRAVPKGHLEVHTRRKSGSQGGQ